MRQCARLSPDQPRDANSGGVDIAHRADRTTWACFPNCENRANIALMLSEMRGACVGQFTPDLVSACAFRLCLIGQNAAKKEGRGRERMTEREAMRARKKENEKKQRMRARQGKGKKRKRLCGRRKKRSYRVRARSHEILREKRSKSENLFVISSPLIGASSESVCELIGASIMSVCQLIAPSIMSVRQLIAAFIMCEIIQYVFSELEQKKTAYLMLLITSAIAHSKGLSMAFMLYFQPKF